MFTFVSLWDKEKWDRYYNNKSFIVTKCPTTICWWTLTIQALPWLKEPSAIIDEIIVTKNCEDLRLTSLRFVILKASDLRFKGTQMGPLLVLVSPCFNNVSCLCNLNFLLRIVIVFSCRNQILKWHSSEKGYFGPTFHTFQSPGKRYRNSFSTYPTYKHVFCSSYWLFCLPNL